MRSLAVRGSCFAIVILSAPALAQTTWYVDGSGSPPGSGTGGDPYTSIQYAIDQPATQSGDTLVVAAGLYIENLDFSGKTLIVVSAEGPEITILDGSNGGSVVTVASGEGPGTRLEGFTVTGGTGTGVDPGCTKGGGVYCVGSELEVLDCIVIENDSTPYCAGLGAGGGGLYADGATLTVRDSVVDDNVSGGGIAAVDSTILLEGDAITRNSQFGEVVGPASGVTLVSCSASILGCDISENGRFDIWGADQGGGLYVEGGTLQLLDSTVSGNTNCFRGGGIVVVDGQITIERSTISDNVSLDCYWGGGIYVHSDGAPVLVVRDTVFAGNAAGDGGGAYVAGGSASFEWCTFSENRSSALAYYELGNGGGLFAAERASVVALHSVFRGNRADGKSFFFGGKGGAVFGAASLDHCTLVSNQAKPREPGTEPPEGGATLGCSLSSSITWDNEPEDLDRTSTAAFSCVRGGWPGPGNVGLDPHFHDLAGGDFHLAIGSPCIGAGADSSDMGAYPFDPAYCGEGCSSEIGTRTCSPAVPNSSGMPGTMVVTGSEVVADDDLSLWALGLPASGNVGFFIMGTGSNTFTPQGSAGPICVAPGIRRFLPLIDGNSTDLAGGFGREVGTSGPVSGQIAPGSTWGFQAWHRDGQGLSNLTDAVLVTFR